MLHIIFLIGHYQMMSVAVSHQQRARLNLVRRGCFQPDSRQPSAFSNFHIVKRENCP